MRELVFEQFFELHFTIPTPDISGDSVTGADLRAAILERLASLDDAALREAIVHDGNGCYIGDDLHADESTVEAPAPPR